MKKWDYVILGFAVACLFGSFFLSRMVLTQSDGVPMVVIQSDRKLVYEKELTPQLTDSILVESEWGYNRVVIENGSVHIHEASCPDQTCTKDWHIQRTGQLIFCLPNRLIVEIKGRVESEVDDVSQ